MPVINKIDLPSAEPDRVANEIEDIIGIEAMDAPRISAKTGLNIEEVLEQIVEKIPAPSGDPEASLKALIFDSKYDAYKGVIIFCRLFDGSVRKGTQIKMMATGASYDVVEVCVHTPKEKKVKELVTGEVGIVVASIKNIEDVKVGDTITLANNPCLEALPGYKPMKPMVFCGLYPLESNKYPDLREALDKLKLNDASLEYLPETSKALGFGFRCGFLGLLHMEIIEERIEREFGIDLIATSPSVVYEVTQTDGSVVMVDSPVKLPERQRIDDIKEPYIRTNIFVPSEYIGPIMELCQNKRGNYVSMEYLDQTRVNIHYEIPLSEIVYDFFDKLKSTTKGYASFDYELIGYKSSKLVKMDILLNGEVVDALSVIVHKDFAYNRGKAIVENLRRLIPRQQFEVPIQAVIGTKAIARADIKAVRKNVLAKCYGGDVSRKRKLLEKQKEGKKRMKMVGSVEIPQEAFLSVLSMDED
jgi:GTP-binding protein LepA